MLHIATHSLKFHPPLTIIAIASNAFMLVLKNWSWTISLVEETTRDVQRQLMIKTEPDWR